MCGVSVFATFATVAAFASFAALPALLPWSCLERLVFGGFCRFLRAIGGWVLHAVAVTAFVTKTIVLRALHACLAFATSVVETIASRKLLHQVVWQSLRD